MKGLISTPKVIIYGVHGCRIPHVHVWNTQANV